MKKTFLVLFLLGSGLAARAQLVADGATATINGVVTNLGAGNLIVGTNGPNTTLILTNGGYVSDFNGTIGYNASTANNRVLVTGSGSLWANQNLLGYACTRYELKQRGEVMEIWATGRLLPFQPYVQNQPHRFGPRMMEEQWGEMLKAKKLFPLLAVLRFERPAAPAGGGSPSPGPERLRFEVKSVKPDKITDETLFEPPPDYHEIQPLPF